MTIFMIIEGSPEQYRPPQRTYFIFPENGFYVTEPHGKEVMLFPSTGETWKYILRFNLAHEATNFAAKMSRYSEGQRLVPLNTQPKWTGRRYFKP